MSKTAPNQASALFDELINQTAEKEVSQESEVDLSDMTEALSESETDSLNEQNSIDKSQIARLEPIARRAMIRLMRQGVITAKQSPGIFESLRKFQKPIQDHLADMYLKMTLDAASGIVLLQEQVESDLEPDEDEPVSLISRRTLTLYDTLLLLVLRKHFQERESSGEQQIFVDIEQVESLLTPFLPLTNSSRSDRRALNGALEKMKERKIVSLSNDNERLEITPVIRYVVNADFLQEMFGRYQTLSEQAAEAPSSQSSLQEVNHD